VQLNSRVAVNPIVAAIKACQTATEIFETLNRFFAWSQETRTNFVAYGPMHIDSTRDILAWRVGLRHAAKIRGHRGKPTDDLSLTAEALSAAWQRLEELGR
jgi:hypothetical protein